MFPKLASVAGNPALDCKVSVLSVQPNRKEVEDRRLARISLLTSISVFAAVSFSLIASRAAIASENALQVAIVCAIAAMFIAHGIKNGLVPNDKIGKWFTVKLEGEDAEKGEELLKKLFPCKMTKHKHIFHIYSGPRRHPQVAEDTDWLPDEVSDEGEEKGEE